jgi:hypothetical protein
MDNAIISNLKYQKIFKKKKFTKPIYFYLIEKFISKKELICYGGTAINAYLPNDKKFYEDIDIFDYDCYSSSALKDAVELSNILIKYNVANVEVKSAMFKGTYKIFINFISIVDFTQMDANVYYNIHSNSIKINNLLYASPNYLRISLYQELSRPLGDVSRWDKIYKRLNLLNEIKPLYISNCSISEKDLPETDEFIQNNKQLINIIKDNKLVVFGDYGLSFYLKFFPKKYQKIDRQINIPYVIVDNIDDVLKLLKFNYTKKYYSYGLIKDFYQILYNGYPVIYVFITNSCQSYNIVNGQHIATIDTIMSIYYGLSFINLEFLNTHKILSYCYLLHNVSETTGVCKRFNMPCIGNQMSIEDIRVLRDKKHAIYKKYKSKKIFKEYFFQYKPRISHKKRN